MGLEKDCPLGVEWANVMWYDTRTREWGHCQCMDCDVELTPSNYANYVTEKGEDPEPWEDKDSFAVIARTADVTELVCFNCWMKRMGE
ncbi:hypothetical protein LCGC14_2953990 [marine sediment metagenome]|uniref:Uncharacterized protein n=1 Tax=marine sediment metagenome TaxID=412755 RepID=A0A0F9A5K6_9ZZZZ